MTQLAEQDAAEWAAVEAGAWPLQRLADDLCADLVDPAWHLRHGAAVGLRAILRSHAACAAVTAPTLGLPTGVQLLDASAGRPMLHTHVALYYAELMRHVVAEDGRTMLAVVLRSFYSFSSLLTVLSYAVHQSQPSVWRHRFKCLVLIVRTQAGWQQRARVLLSWEPLQSPQRRQPQQPTWGGWRTA